MKPSEIAREYIINSHIKPARSRGDTIIILRAGNIHSELNFKNRLPVICSVLGSNTFEELAEVERISIEGPIMGANALFTFKL